ncbi:MAG: 2-phosphosulfolactate phosphatase [Acidiferrobacterales bacterium]
MQKLHVLTRKEELDPSRLADKVVVVLDVLFATSTIVTALQHGASEVIPVPDEAAAREESARHTNGTFVLAGEKKLERIPGFAPYAPLALAQHDLADKQLIYSTTNGTVALRRAEDAPHVYAAALLNGEAVMNHILVTHPNETVLILCAGSSGRFNVEDFFAAGLLVDRLLGSSQGQWTPTDAALAARAVYKQCDAEACLRSSRIGQIMEQRGHADEVRFAARIGEYSLVPSLQNGRVKCLATH